MFLEEPCCELILHDILPQYFRLGYIITIFSKDLMYRKINNPTLPHLLIKKNDQRVERSKHEIC